MHQTFYIDIDEEITSIVDRLRKSQAEEIIIVVPKRALLIQSIVNLKLLKKESDGMGKQVVIVTQDKLGKLLVEKTGILVQQRIDDVDGEEIVLGEEEGEKQEESVANSIMSYNTKEKEIKNDKINTIGSAEYFEEKPKNTKTKAVPRKISKGEAYGQKGDIINKELVVSDVKASNQTKTFSGKKNALDMVRKIDVKKTAIPEVSSNAPVSVLPGSFFEGSKETRENSFDSSKEQPVRELFQDDKLRSFFQPKGDVRLTKQESYDYKNVNVSGKLWKFILIFGLVAIIAILAVAAYLFLPKADVKILTKGTVKTLSIDVKGSSQVNSIDYENNAIPARLISAEDELSKSYPATGISSKSSTSQKARGTITIYNEFNASPQTLVATTRFETGDGKIFRLVKTTTVPGMAQVGTEMKPGAIEADVVADEAGDKYNIESTSFTIPGFKDSGNDKYKKFYAKSFKAMSGGGSSSDAIKVVSKSDIEDAKNGIAKEINAAIRNKIKGSSGDNEIILDDAISSDSVTYNISKNENDVADSFTVEAKVKGNALALARADLEDLAGKNIVAKTGENEERVKEAVFSFEFGKPETDLANGIITVRVDVLAKITPNISTDAIKKEILGKKGNELKDQLSAHPEIQKIEVNYWPVFISGRIPSLRNRVNVTLDNSF